MHYTAHYALATIPLIKKLKGNSKRIWYADDAVPIGRITDLREWWDHLTTKGPGFGYFPNPSKTWLVTKEGCYAAGISTFANTGVNLTSDGRPYLGAAVGSRKFVKKHVEYLWLSCVCNLTTIAKTQPHAAYSALTHGLLSKWTYLCHAVSNISNLLKPLDDIFRTKLIPALTGRPPPSDLECALFALPARLGGLGITISSKQADQEHQSSLLSPPPSMITSYPKMRTTGMTLLPSNWNPRPLLDNKPRRKTQRMPMISPPSYQIACGDQ